MIEMELINLLLYAVEILGVLFLFETVLLILTGKDVIFGLKARFLKKRGYGKIIEMKSNRTIETSIARIGEDNAIIPNKKFGDRTYAVYTEDIAIDKNHQLPVVVVNQGACNSVPFQYDSKEPKVPKISSEQLTILLKRALNIGALEGMNKEMKKLMQLIVIVGGVTIIGILALGYFLYNQNKSITELNAGMQALINITRGTVV